MGTCHFDRREVRFKLCGTNRANRQWDAYWVGAIHESPGQFVNLIRAIRELPLRHISLNRTHRREKS